MWFITQTTALIALYKGGGGAGGYALTLGTGFIFVVFLMSIYFGTKNITYTDTFVLLIALIAIILWWQLHQPLLAVIMIALIDSVACYPTWRKTLKDPSSETLWTWVAFTLGNALSILVLNQYNALTLIYLITITFTDFSVVLVILYGRYLVKSHLQKHI